MLSYSKAGDMVSKEKSVSDICILVVFAAVIHGARSLSFLDSDNPEEIIVYCFQCNSGLDTDCANLAPNDTSSYHYKPCLDTEKYNRSQPFCRKIVQRIMARDNMERVIRKCGWIRHPRLDCYTVKNDDHEETICQCFEDGCNGSSVLYNFGPFITVLTGLLVYLSVN